MKKIFSLIAITAAAATMFTSCKKEDTGNVVDKKAKLSITAAPATVAVAAEGTFTVTSDINAPEAIVVAIKSSDDKILTVDPASVTIAQGTKTITGKYKGVADGKATITISTTNAAISAGSVEITVGTPPPAGAEIVKMVTGKAESGTYFYAYYEDPTDSAPEGSRANLAYFNFWKNTYDPFSEAAPSLSMDFGLNTAGGIKCMGTLVDGAINISAQPIDTKITFDAMLTSENYPVLWSPAYTANATGEEIYLAVACGDFETTFDTYRAWIKVKIGTAGGFDNLELIEAYVCLNDGEFKVGQKE